MKNTNYPWQLALSEAISETDSENLGVRLAAADDAVFYRLLEMEGSDDDAERLALEDAMEDIRLLRSLALRFRFIV